MRLPARRWKASCDRRLSFGWTGETPVATRAKHRAAARAALFASVGIVGLEHLEAVNVDLVAVDVAGHGNVMPLVTLEGLGIVHRQNFLVSVGNKHCFFTGCDALLCACLRTRVGSLNAAFRIADPAVHSLGIAGK